MPNTKPLLRAACICDHILTEKDGTVSLIRIVDRVVVTVPPQLPPNAQTGFPVNVFVGLKSDDKSHAGVLRITAHRPDGTTGAPVEVPVEIAGAKGVNVQGRFDVLSPQPGIYWFDVNWENESLTRIPLEVTVVAGHPLPAQAKVLPAPKSNAPEK